MGEFGVGGGRFGCNFAVMEQIDDILRENARRVELQRAAGSYDPTVEIEGIDAETRMREDFEYWAARCVRIYHKDTRELTAFVLNGGQRKVLARLEAQRRSRRPIRAVILKSRQWGCSTLVAYYFMWIQLFHHENWHSVVCAHNKDSARQIVGMYDDLVANSAGEGCELKFRSYRGCRNVQELAPRGCRVVAASARRPDAVRGTAISMAHLTEVAYWPETSVLSPEMTLRSICSSIPRVADTAVVMESTANGAGGYFHKEWLRAIDGKSDKEAIFVSWHECEYFREELSVSVEEFWAGMDDYERMLWGRGLTLEQIQWYRSRLLECGGNRRQLMAEYPLTADEAFSNSLPPVFAPALLEQQREENVREPERVAEVSVCDGEIVDDERGRLEIWAEPCGQSEVRSSMPYLVSVDVGGNYDEGDWSVVAVFDCRREGKMELVAQWRGHTDADRLCRIATALGRRYHKAMLVVESNSLEARGLDLLERVAATGYRNIYRRQCLDSATGEMAWKYGFHTNQQTKTAAITDLTAALRDGVLVERSALALSEMGSYVRTRSGGMEATRGCHDDLVMTRAIAAYALRQNPPRWRRGG